MNTTTGIIIVFGVIGLLAAAEIYRFVTRRRQHSIVMRRTGVETR
jgi:uncharacterized membrane protein YsdA (DUF1294 family)